MWFIYCRFLYCRFLYCRLLYCRWPPQAFTSGLEQSVNIWILPSTCCCRHQAVIIKLSIIKLMSILIITITTITDGWPIPHWPQLPHLLSPSSFTVSSRLLASLSKCVKTKRKLCIWLTNIRRNAFIRNQSLVSPTSWNLGKQPEWKGINILFGNGMTLLLWLYNKVKVLA